MARSTGPVNVSRGSSALLSSSLSDSAVRPVIYFLQLSEGKKEKNWKERRTKNCRIRRRRRAAVWQQQLLAHSLSTHVIAWLLMWTSSISVCRVWVIEPPAVFFFLIRTWSSIERQPTKLHNPRRFDLTCALDLFGLPFHVCFFFF